MRGTVALLLVATLIAPGCATSRTTHSRFASSQTTAAIDPALLTSYLRQLPIGSRVRAMLTTGASVRGTLMRVSDQGITIQRRTRLPEAPVDILMVQIRAVEPETPNSVGKTVAIGAAVGAGAALGLLMVLAAIFADD